MSQGRTWRVGRRGWGHLYRVDPLGEVLVDFRGVVQFRVAPAAAADRVDVDSAVQPVVVSRVRRVGLAVVTLQDVVAGRPGQAAFTVL